MKSEDLIEELNKDKIRSIFKRLKNILFEENPYVIEGILALMILNDSVENVALELNPDLYSEIKKLHLKVLNEAIDRLSLYEAK